VPTAVLFPEALVRFEVRRTLGTGAGASFSRAMGAAAGGVALGMGPTLTEEATAEGAGGRDIIGRAEIAERPDRAEIVTDGPGASVGEPGGGGAAFETEIEST
jgi:hypothetical protein